MCSTCWSWSAVKVSPIPFIPLQQRWECGLCVVGRVSPCGHNTKKPQYPPVLLDHFQTPRVSSLILGHRSKVKVNFGTLWAGYSWIARAVQKILPQLACGTNRFWLAHYPHQKCSGQNKKCLFLVALWFEIGSVGQLSFLAVAPRTTLRICRPGATRTPGIETSGITEPNRLRVSELIYTKRNVTMKIQFILQHIH